MTDRGRQIDGASLVERSRLSEKVREVHGAASVLWRVAVTLGFLVFVILVSQWAIWKIVADATTEIGVNRMAGEQTRSATCLSLYLNGNRDFSMPGLCTAPEVARFYPPEVCAAVDMPPTCGVDFGGT